MGEPELLAKVVFNAVACGQHATMKSLLVARVDANIPVGQSKRPPLMASAAGSHRDICSLLVDFGADVLQVDTHGRTAKDLSGTLYMKSWFRLKMKFPACLAVVASCRWHSKWYFWYIQSCIRHPNRVLLAARWYLWYIRHPSRLLRAVAACFRR